MDTRVKTHIQLLMASAIVVTSRNHPVRIVLYKRKNEYVTHMECLTTTTPADGTSCAFEHASFKHGGYFGFKSDRQSSGEQEALHSAQADFKDRVRKLFHT